MASEKEAKSTKAAKSFVATYTVPELVEAASSEFGTSSVIVRAALKKAGKKTYTMREAKQLVEKMKNKEVKA